MFVARRSRVTNTRIIDNCIYKGKFVSDLIFQSGTQNLFKHYIQSNHIIYIWVCLKSCPVYYKANLACKNNYKFKFIELTCHKIFLMIYINKFYL